MDEIFGEDNFVAELIWSNHEGGGGSDSRHFRIKHEYIVVYSTDYSKLVISQEVILEDDSYSFQDDYLEERGKYKLIKLNSFSIQYSQSLDYEIVSPDGSILLPSENRKKGCWRWSKSKLEWGLQNSFIEFRTNSEGKEWVYTKQYFKVDNNNQPIVRSLPPKGVINQFSSTLARKQLECLFESKVFSYSKPVDLISKLVGLSPEKNAVILDCFAGSGTTGHAVMKLNAEDGGQRQYICVQLPEKLDPKNKNQATACDFLDGIQKPRTIAEITKERLRRAGAKIRQEHPLFHGDLGFKVFKLADSTVAPKHSTYNSRKTFEAQVHNEADKYQEALKNQHRLAYMTQTPPEAIAWEVAIKKGYELTERLVPIMIGNIEGYAIFPPKPEEPLASHLPHLLVIPTGVFTDQEDLLAFTKKLQGVFPTKHLVLWEGLFQGDDANKRSVMDAIKTFKEQLTDRKGVPVIPSQLRIEVIRL